MRTRSLVSCLFVTLIALPTWADVKTNRPAPDFEKPLLGGGTLRLSSMRGKVVLLDFWASWCEPCKKELPLLSALAARLRPKGIEIVAVNIDDDSGNGQKFLDSHSVKLAVVDDHDHKVVSLYEPPKMPSSYEIDTDGIVRGVNGGFEPGDEAKIEKRLLALLPR